MSTFAEMEEGLLVLTAALRGDPACEHIATVTTQSWPVVHTSPVNVLDDVLVLPPIDVTECVTCGAVVPTPTAPEETP